MNGFVKVRPSRERNRLEECFRFFCGLSPGTFLLLRSNRIASYPGDRFLSFRHKKYGWGVTSLQDANRDVPLDGVAFS